MFLKYGQTRKNLPETFARRVKIRYEYTVLGIQVEGCKLRKLFFQPTRNRDHEASRINETDKRTKEREVFFFFFLFETL
jgi:hypothetical protein